MQQESQERVKGAEKIFEEIMAKNPKFAGKRPYISKKLKLQVWYRDPHQDRPWWKCWKAKGKSWNFQERHDLSHKQQLSRDRLLPWLLSPGSGLLCSASEQHRLHLYNTLFTRQCLSRSCPTFCDPVDCSPPGASVHGILQARTLEWIAIPFSRGSSQPRD